MNTITTQQRLEEGVAINLQVIATQTCEIEMLKKALKVKDETSETLLMDMKVSESRSAKENKLRCSDEYRFRENWLENQVRLAILQKNFYAPSGETGNEDEIMLSTKELPHTACRVSKSWDGDKTTLPSYVCNGHHLPDWARWMIDLVEEEQEVYICEREQTWSVSKVVTEVGCENDSAHFRETEAATLYIDIYLKLEDTEECLVCNTDCNRKGMMSNGDIWMCEDCHSGFC